MNNKNFVFDIFHTVFGWIGLVAGNKGVIRICLPEQTREEALKQCEPEILLAVKDSQHLSGIVESIQSYCAGHTVDLVKIPVDFRTSPDFFLRAWKACRTIPRGETRSYKWLATSAGNINGARAAGQAMARNKLPLLVPCHRVVASDGNLHGFGGAGVKLKYNLLEMEKNNQKIKGR